MLRSRPAFGLACASLLWALLLSPATHAQETDIATVLEQAQEHYDAGRFRQAVPLLLRAHEELGAAVILYRLGNVFNSLGNFRRAREYYEQFLKSDPKTDLRGRVEAKIETLKRLEEASQSWLVVHLDHDGQVFQLNDRAHAIGSTSEKIPVGSGVHQVVVASSQGHEFEIEVDVAAAATVERWVSFDPNGLASVSLEKPAPVEKAEEPPKKGFDEAETNSSTETTAAEETNPPSDEEVGSKVVMDTGAIEESAEAETSRPQPFLWASIATTVAGAGVLGFAAYNDLVVIPDALDEQQAIIDEGRTNADSYDEIDEALGPSRTRRQTAATSALVGYSLGGVLMVTGVALGIIHMGSEDGSEATTWYPVFTPRTVGWGLEF